MSEEAVEEAVEHLYSELFAAAGESRRWGDQLTARDGQTQARWQLMWTAAAGSWTVPQIARRLGVSRQNIQRLTNELAGEGLVNLDQNPDHKSSPIVRLNSAGQEVLNRINTSAAAYNRQIHTTLGAQRISELRTALRDFVDLIKQLEASHHDHDTTKEITPSHPIALPSQETSTDTSETLTTNKGWTHNPRAKNRATAANGSD